MLISLRWIREFCPFVGDESPAAIGARFSLHAAEVEGVAERGAALAQVRAARVVDVRPHPNAERLVIAAVDAGAGAAVEVVCGAPNVRPGLVAPFAPPGAVIAGREIQAVEVRGVLSRGMLCSLQELEVSQEGDGLWELPADASPGTPLAEVFPEIRDVVLEVDNKSLTHRPDLWGHYGLAREFAAIYETPLEPLAVDRALAGAPGRSAVRVSVAGEGVGGRRGLCRRYCGLQIDGIEVAPSPPWLRHRLLAVGSRPISNIVDVTNYILFELGQPLHAFDTARVGGGEIVVRRAGRGERLELLDGSRVDLDPEDLVIADARAPVALAGIMGGAGTEISAGTSSIFLESANFAPARVRRSSLRIGKRTDSSLRFEKSLDPANAWTAILRAAAMVLKLCPGARVVGPLQDVGFEPEAPIEIRTSAQFIAARLGTELPARRSRAILERLGFEVAGDDGGEWRVRVPTWRATKDVSIAEDLVEEVGRIHGYDNIRPRAPLWPVAAAPPNAQRLLERQAKGFLALHGGLTEVYTYSMVGAAHCRFFGLDAEAHLKIKNPVSEDLDRLRREIVPLHLEKARDNQRYLDAFGFFELGRVFLKPREQLRAPELPEERNRLAGVLSFPEKRPENFHAVRHVILSLLDWLRVAGVEAVAAPAAALPPWAHPAVAARLVASGAECGSLYRVHPAFESRLEFRGDVIAFDLDFDAIFRAPRREIAYRPPSRFPTVPFDVAVVAPARTPVGEIRRLIEGAAGDLLRSVEVFDVFQREDLGAERKSVALRLVFGSPERTLGTEEVNALQERTIRALEAAGYQLRGA